MATTKKPAPESDGEARAKAIASEMNALLKRPASNDLTADMKLLASVWEKHGVSHDTLRAAMNATRMGEKMIVPIGDGWAVEHKPQGNYRAIKA